MGYFGTKNGSKMGQKYVFPKMILDHLGCLNKWNEPAKGGALESMGFGVGQEKGPRAGGLIDWLLKSYCFF